MPTYLGVGNSEVIVGITNQSVGNNDVLKRSTAIMNAEKTSAIVKSAGTSIVMKNGVTVTGDS